jgi:hypothetical protein
MIIRTEEWKNLIRDKQAYSERAINNLINKAEETCSFFVSYKYLVGNKPKYVDFIKFNKRIQKEISEIKRGYTVYYSWLNTSYEWQLIPAVEMHEVLCKQLEYMEKKTIASRRLLNEQLRAIEAFANNWVREHNESQIFDFKKDNV